MNTVEIIKKLYFDLKADTELCKEIEYLQKIFSISDEEAISAWVFWDTNLKEYSNEVYKSETMRFVMHLHCLLKDSWHEKRQNEVLKILEKIDPRSIVEIGFGTPQKYVKNYINKDIHISLLDFDRSALNFSESLLSLWSTEWRKNIELDLFDINKDSLPEGFSVYVFQDSIEHADNPTETLKKFVSSGAQGTHFIFSLPVEIEDPIPEHHIFWKNISHAEMWLEECGLHILTTITVDMNRNVDIYAQKLHPDFCEVIVHAIKA